MPEEIAEEGNAAESTETSTSSESTEETSGESQGSEQPSESETQEKVYEFGGRKLTADELAEKHAALEKDYSRKANRLAELEKNYAKSETKVDDRIQEALKTIPPEAQQQLDAYFEAKFKPQILRELTQAEQAKQTRQNWENAFDRLAEQWDGSDGKPKFKPEERELILDKITSDDSTVFDPEVAWKQIHEDEIIDWRIKQAMKQKSGGVKTEKTGTHGTKKPDAKAAKSLDEASNRLMSRLEQSGAFE